MPLLHITPEKTIEIPCALFTSSSVELLLENVSAHPYVAYKIKTTAPKSYLVRPSSGVVPQGQTRSVQIVLQALTEEPSRTSSDRFLVQATPVESSLPLPRNYWLSLSKSDVEETRLSVVFKRTNSTAHAAPGAPGASQQQDPNALPDEAAAAAAAAAAGGGGGGALRTGGGGPSSPPEGLGSATLPAAAGAGSSSSKDLKQQYDQLVEYTLALEKHKEDLASEIEMLKQQLEARSSRGLGELWHLPVYLFVLFMAWYLLDRSFGGGASAAGASAPRA